MKNKFIKITFLVFVLLAILFSKNMSFATEQLTENEENSYYSSGYYISKYDVNMVVNEDNSYDITETINAVFTGSNKHGIIRKIPINNTVIRNDGTTAKTHARITGIQVNKDYSISTEDGYKSIKIGSASEVVKGSQTYIIKYKYALGKDKLKNADEFYFNIIGTEWDTTINAATFTITMPKEFDDSTLGFTSGSRYSTDTSNVYHRVDGNVITGSIFRPLSSYSGLTIRLTLPDGYFKASAFRLDTGTTIITLMCIVFMGITFFWWYKYGRDEKPVETVEFYPPKGFNSAEVEFLYKGEVTSKGVISLLIYLADKGYLKIEETEKKFLGASKGFKITKLKEYDGTNQNEKMFFNGLFSRSERSAEKSIKALDLMNQNKNLTWEQATQITENIMKSSGQAEEEYVTEEDLYDSFYRTINKIKERINSKENKKVIFESTATKKVKFVILMMVIIFITLTIKTVISTGNLSDLLIMIIFSGLGISAITYALVGNDLPMTSRIFLIIWGLGFGGFPFIEVLNTAIFGDPDSVPGFIIGIVSMIILGIFAKIMPKRTTYGNELLGKVKGFKNFLETAEKPKLEELVEQNPTYFYDILPYTYALGVSEKWMKQFEKMNLQAPDWYSGYGDHFTVITFNNFMNSTMRSAQSAMTSIPSSSGGSSGGGFSSGGGSSGGGSGGGGGSSW